MKRTLKVLLGVVALALIGVSTASAQTGALLGKDLFLFDGGTGSTQNYVQLISPDAATLTTNWTLTLPPDGGGLNYILVNTDGAGATEWQDGLSLFWGIEGNCDPIVPWDPNTQTGNYIGHCLNDLDFRSGDDFMNFWFNTMLYPVFTINENGTMTLQTGDGYEGLIIGGEPGGTTGPDAGIVFDCTLPPTVALEINALATGILMPTCAAPPLTGIDLQAQTLGIRSVAPTALWAQGAVDIDLGVGQYVNISGTTADATATEILLLDGSSNVVTRTIGAGTAIVTGSGTQYTLPLWVDAAGTEIGNSIVTQDAGATTATVGGNAVVTGTSDLQGNVSNSTGDLTLDDNIGVTGSVTIDPTDVALSATDTRVLTQNGSGLVGYRTIPANGDIVVSAGPLTGNGAVTTNASGQLISTAMTNGQVIIGSTGNAPVFATITEGTGIDIANGAGTITISSEIPDGAANQTLRWDGGTSAWVASSALQNDGTDVTATGALSVNGNTTLGDAAADVVTINAATIDITNVGSSAASTNLLRRNASGDIEVSSAVFPTIPGGSLAANRNVRTDGSGGLTVGAIVLNGGPNEVSGILPVDNGGTGIDGSAAANGTLLIGNGTGYTLTTLTEGTGIDIVNAAGSITISSEIPDGAANQTLRWNGVSSAWEASSALQNDGSNVSMTGNLTVDGNTTLGNAAGDALTINAATVNAPNLPASGVNTDNFVVSNGSLIRTASVTTMIGGYPWVLGGNTSGITNVNNILGISNNAIAENLRIQVRGFTAIELVQADGSTNVNYDLSAFENTNFGDNAGDLMTVIGNVNINSAFTTAQAVNINTGDANHTTTIGFGDGTTTNTTNLNSDVIVAPNLPTAVGIDEFVTRDPVTNDLSVIANTSTGYPWLVGGNASPSTTGMGTTTDQGVTLITNNIQRINLQNSGSGYATQINTDAATGDVIIGNAAADGDGIQLASPEILAPNIPVNNATTYVLVYDNTTGQIAKKDVGTPVQTTKTAQATITGTGATAVFNIVDAFVVANSIIMVTLQDGGVNPDNNNYTVAIQAVAAGNFDIRLSGIVANTETKVVNYTVVNP